MLCVSLNLGLEKWPKCVHMRENFECVERVGEWWLWVRGYMSERIYAMCDAVDDEDKMRKREIVSKLINLKILKIKGFTIIKCDFCTKNNWNSFSM